MRFQFELLFGSLRKYKPIFILLFSLSQLCFNIQLFLPFYCVVESGVGLFKYDFFFEVILRGRLYKVLLIRRDILNAGITFHFDAMVIKLQS